MANFFYICLGSMSSIIESTCFFLRNVTSSFNEHDVVNTSNAFPDKPIGANQIYIVNSSLSTQDIIFIFLLSF